MGTPKTPNVVYLDSLFSKAGVQCDPELPARALQYRMANQLMDPDDFYLNITVWKIVSSGGQVEYIVRQNDSDEANLEKVVQQHMDKGLTRRQAKKAANEYKAYSGVHSEVNVVAEIYNRPGIKTGSPAIAEVFTEREPCFECRAFMKNNFPIVARTPFFYYLSGLKTEKAHHRQADGGHIGLFFLRVYGV